MGFNHEIFFEITGSILLFCLVFGMSATVDVSALTAQLKNYKAIFTGIFCQFVVLPFLGFLVVRLMQLDHPTGVILLVVTSSPGGSYSNWWCSMFNADLALSVAMTAISTLASTIMLPLNLVVYARYSYNDDIVQSLNWMSVVAALSIVICAIALGLWASASFRSHNFNLHANRLGNFAGILLVIFSAIMSNSDAEARVWNREWQFYVGVALPCMAGLIVANVMSTCLGLPKPERVTVSIECCYQNVGIATSVAISMFNGYQLAQAVAVPFYYGFVEAVVLLSYCLVAWKAGWTKAPSDVSFWKMLAVSYEILSIEEGCDGETEKDGFCYVDQGAAATPPVAKEPSYIRDPRTSAALHSDNYSANI